MGFRSCGPRRRHFGFDWANRVKLTSFMRSGMPNFAGLAIFVLEVSESCRENVPRTKRLVMLLGDSHEMSWAELLNLKLGDFLGIYTFLNFMIHYCLFVLDQAAAWDMAV